MILSMSGDKNEAKVQFCEEMRGTTGVGEEGAGNGVGVGEDYEDNMVEVKTTSYAPVFAKRLTSAGRRLTSKQSADLADLLSDKTSLYGDLLLAEARDWLPWTHLHDFPIDTAALVERVVERAARKHGKRIVQHAISFVDASLVGITDAEIVDLMTPDFKSDSSSRFSAVAWLAVKRSLRPLLSYGVYTRWRCPAVAAMITSRWPEYAHNRLADYFTGARSVSRCNSGATPSVKEGATVVLPFPVNQPVIISADRHIYNDRKLCELPHHLATSGRFSELEQNVLFNYDWIHATIYSKRTINDGNFCFTLCDHNNHIYYMNFICFLFISIIMCFFLLKGRVST